MQAYCRCALTHPISTGRDTPRRRICEHQRDIQARSAQLYCEDLIDRKVDNPNLGTTTVTESRNKFATAPPFSLTISPLPAEVLTGTIYIYISLPLLRCLYYDAPITLSLSIRSSTPFLLRPAARAPRTNGKRID